MDDINFWGGLDGNMVKKQNPLKETILKFMTRHKGNMFSQTEISERTKISYPSVLKWVGVLIAEDKIKHKDYKNIKLIWVE